MYSAIWTYTMTKSTLNSYVINLLAETYQKVSLEKTAGTGFFCEISEGTEICHKEFLWPSEHNRNRKGAVPD